MTRKLKRDPEKALRTKKQLERIWNERSLTSPFLKAVWITTADGEVFRRESKEKIREYTREPT